MLKFGIILSMLLLGFVVTTGANARDERLRFPIADPMATTTAEGFTGVKFYFGESRHPAVQRSWGTFSSRKTTNAFGKSDKAACDWAFLSAVKSFWERAQKEGGNAVIGMKSVTTGAPFSSSTEYECRAGNVIAKVYLEGTVVQLR